MLANAFSRHRWNISYQGKIGNTFLERKLNYFQIERNFVRIQFLIQIAVWICWTNFFVWFDIHRFYSSLKKKCAKRVCKNLSDWIEVQRPGPFSLNANQPTSNVFIADFIELNNFQFCRTVIKLNEKIFHELTISEREKNGSNKNSNKNEKEVSDDCECEYIESNNLDIQSWCFIFIMSKILLFAFKHCIHTPIFHGTNFILFNKFISFLFIFEKKCLLILSTRRTCCTDK